jgi:hypothetical protein
MSRPENLHDAERIAPPKPKHDQKTVVAVRRDKDDHAVIMTISKAKK